MHPLHEHDTIKICTMYNSRLTPLFLGEPSHMSVQDPRDIHPQPVEFRLHHDHKPNRLYTLYAPGLLYKLIVT